MRKRDLQIILIILFVAAAAYGVMLLARGGTALSDTVSIYVDGSLYASAPLDRDGEIEVLQPDGHVNIVAIEGGAVHMAYSSCRNQLCLQQGEVTRENWQRRTLGRTIVCLPNRVLVEIDTQSGDGDTGEVDFNRPDV